MWLAWSVEHLFSSPNDTNWTKSMAATNIRMFIRFFGGGNNMIFNKCNAIQCKKALFSKKELLNITPNFLNTNWFSLFFFFKRSPKTLLLIIAILWNEWNNPIKWRQEFQSRVYLWAQRKTKTSFHGALEDKWKW